jgi:hypothetical protein
MALRTCVKPYLHALHMAPVVCGIDSCSSWLVPKNPIDEPTGASDVVLDPSAPISFYVSRYI